MSTDDKLIQELKEATEAMKQELEVKEEIKADVTESTDTSSSETVEERVYTDIEKQAMAEGWDPKGPKSAEQYQHDGSFFKKIKEQKKEIFELKEAFKSMTAHQKKMEKAAYEKALNDFRAERNAAVEIGDVDRVEHLQDKMDSAKEHIKALDMEVKVATASVVDTDSVNKAARSFQETNKDWFDIDLLKKDVSTLQGKELQNYKMTKAAMTYDEYIGMKRNAGDPAFKDHTPEQALKAVEDFIKDTYAERFTKENPNKDAPSAVGKSTASGSSSTGSDKLVSKMTPHQKQVYEMYRRIDPSFGSIEEYAKQLHDIGDLK